MSFVRFLRDTREWATPVLKESEFLSKGQLTPEEFISSGDALVLRCPIWSWSGAASRAHSKPHLPSHKQYLIARNIVSIMRVADMDAKVEDEFDDYCLPSIEIASERGGSCGGDDDAVLVDIDTDGNGIEKCASTQQQQCDNSDDISELADSVAGNLSLSSDEKERETRYYEISITYDKFYRTPRVFFSGYQRSGAPLCGEQLLQDVNQENSRRTVTLDPHPHTGKIQASIHPCQHANAMLTIIRGLAEDSGITVGVEVYLFIFLKFLHSIIPSIDFDFQEVDLGMHRAEG
jgi:ubiquitin-like-conjugating enzyme ATG3